MEGNAKSLNQRFRDSGFKFQDKGQTLVELLLALGIFAFIMTAVFALVFGGLTTGLRTEEQDYATMYAQEGLDAARSIRDTDWNAFAQNGTHGVANSGTGWSWNGTTYNDATYGARKFTREIFVEDVYRTASGDIFTGSNSANFDYTNNADYQCEGATCPSANLKIADGAAKLNGSVRLDDSVNPKELTADTNAKALFHFNSPEGKELALGNLGGVPDANLKGLWHFNDVSPASEETGSWSYPGVDWQYRKAIDIQGSLIAQSNYQVLIPVDTQSLITAGKMKTDGSDIRFSNAAGASLDFWIESGMNTASTKIWVEVDSIAASPTITTIYVYYGNSVATALSNGDNAFNFFYDFAGTTINTAKLDYGGGTIAQNNELSIINNGTDAWDTYVYTDATFARSSTPVFQAKFKANSGARSMIGWHENAAGASYIDLIYAIYFNNGTFNVYESDGSTTYNRGSFGTYTVGQWYDIKIELKSAGGATYYYKLSTSSAWTTLYDSVYSTLTSLRPGAVHYDTTAGEYSYTDNWMVRSYVSPEPMLAIANDATVNNNTGYSDTNSIKDPTLTTAGKFSNALSFDGTDDYVDVGSAINPSGVTGYTIEAWIKSTAGATADAIAGWWDGTNGIFMQSKVASGEGLTVLAGGSTAYGEVNIDTHTNWVHAALVYDGTLSGNANRLKLYVNGVQQTLTPGAGTVPASIPALTSSNFKIGDVGALNRKWAGSIDEVAVYNTPLAPETIKEHYRRGVAEDYNPTPDLNNFEPNDGNIYSARTTASNTGLGEALQFDGIDDYVSTPNNVNLSTTNKVSVEFWAKILTYPSDPRVLVEMSSDYTTVSDSFSIFVGDDTPGANQAIGIIVKGNTGYSFANYDKTLVNDGQWHHWAAILDTSQSGNNEVNLYIDGTLRTPTQRPLTQNNTNNFGSRPFYFASRGGASYFANTVLDEIAIWDKALTQADIWDHVGANLGYATNSYATVKRTINTDYLDRFKEFVETAMIPSGTSIDYQLSTDNCVTFKYWDGDNWEAGDARNDIRTINRYFDQLVPSSSICLSARLNTTDTSQTPVLDNVEIKYSQNSASTGVTLDTHTKRVTSRVKWPSGLSFQDLQLTEYLNDWNYNAWTQTTYNDFFAGETKPPSLTIKDAAFPNDADKGLITPIHQIFQSLDTDFNGGIFTNTLLSGSGSSAKVVLSPGSAPYAASGTYESATIDLGSAAFGLDTLSWDAIVPTQANGAGMAIPAATPDLVGLWHMDSGFIAANDVIDSSASGYNLHGTAGDGAALSPATKKIGAGAGIFTADTGAGGGPSYVEVDYDPALNITTNISVEAWIYVNSFPDTTTNYSDIVRKGFNTFQYILRTGDSTVSSSSKKASFQICKSSSPCISGDDAWVDSPLSAELATGKWHHLVGLYDGAFVRLYVNGIEQGPLLPQNSYSGLIKTGGDVLAIGSGNLSWNDFDGYIDEVAIYDRALTAEEIRMHYASFKLQMAACANASGANKETCNDGSGWQYRGPDNTANTYFIQPVGLWHFNETSGQLSDVSGGGKNGTYNGALYNQTSVAGGNLNGALGFDGIDDAAAIGNIGSEIKTVEFWINNIDDDTSDEILELIDNTSYVSISGGNITAPGFTSPTIYIDGGNKTASPPAVLSSGWHHVAIVTDAPISAASVKIGEANNDYFSGNLDEVAIYDRALTQAEILARYNSGAGYEGAVRTLADAGLNGKQYLRYKAYFGTVDTAYTPELDDVLITNYSTSPPPYTFVSQVYNANGLAKLYSGNWNGSQPVGSTLSLEARAGNLLDMSDATAWTPIGSGASGSFSNLPALNNKQYFQYRANFADFTPGITNTYPILFDVNSAFKGSY